LPTLGCVALGATLATFVGPGVPPAPPAALVTGCQAFEFGARDCTGIVCRGLDALPTLGCVALGATLATCVGPGVPPVPTAALVTGCQAFEFGACDCTGVLGGGLTLAGSSPCAVPAAEGICISGVILQGGTGTPQGSLAAAPQFAPAAWAASAARRKRAVGSKGFLDSPSSTLGPTESWLGPCLSPCELGVAMGSTSPDCTLCRLTL